jgi:hypothetical protein
MARIDQYMSRKEIVTELQKLGYPVTVGTLNRLATRRLRHEGPAYERLPHERGQPTRYRWGDALAWAEFKCPDSRIWQTRQQVAKTLTAGGYPIAAGTLKQMAAFRCGPRYELRGGLAYYGVRAALEWAQRYWAKRRLSVSDQPVNHIEKPRILSQNIEKINGLV